MTTRELAEWFDKRELIKELELRGLPCRAEDNCLVCTTDRNLLSVSEALHRLADLED